jgi:hypothetical protein
VKCRLEIDHVGPRREHGDATKAGQLSERGGVDDRLVGDHDVGATGAPDDGFVRRASEHFELPERRDRVPREVAGVDRVTIENDDACHAELTSETKTTAARR